MNAKGTFLKEMKSAAPLHFITKKRNVMIRKQNSLIADVEKVSAAWIADQTSHSIPLSHSLIQRKALTVFTSIKARRDEEAKEEKLESAEVG